MLGYYTMGSSLNISSAHIRNTSVIKNINVSSTRANGVVTPNDQPIRGTTTVISGLLKNATHPVEKYTATNLEYGQSTMPIMNDLLNFSMSPPVWANYHVSGAFTGTCYFSHGINPVGQSGLNITANTPLNEFVGQQDLSTLIDYQTDFQNWIINSGASNYQIKILTNPVDMMFLPNIVTIQSQILTINLSFRYQQSDNSKNCIYFYCAISDTYYGNKWTFYNNSSASSSSSPVLIDGPLPSNSSNLCYIGIQGNGPISFSIPIQTGSAIDMQIVCDVNRSLEVYVTVTFDLSFKYSS